MLRHFLTQYVSCLAYEQKTIFLRKKYQNKLSRSHCIICSDRPKNDPGGFKCLTTVQGCTEVKPGGVFSIVCLGCCDVKMILS